MLGGLVLTLAVVPQVVQSYLGDSDSGELFALVAIVMGGMGSSMLAWGSGEEEGAAEPAVWIGVIGTIGYTYLLLVHLRKRYRRGKARALARVGSDGDEENSLVDHASWDHTAPSVRTPRR